MSCIPLWQSEFQENNEILLEILRKNSIKDPIRKILKIKMEKGIVSNKVNYRSQVFKINVKVLFESGLKANKRFILKKSYELEGSLLPLQESSNIFRKEIMIYCDILSKFENLMDEFQDPQNRLWCKFYGFKPFSEVYVEDLNVLNFKIAKGKSFLDIKHGLLVMRSLGRFHAMSHVLLQKKILDKEYFNKNFVRSAKSCFIKRLIEGGLKQLSSVMEEHWPPEWKLTAEKLANEAKLAGGKIRKLYTNIPENSFLVMVHGDFWSSNMMFKYSSNDKNTPTEVRFLDYQGSSFNTYMIDIIYFLYSSIDPNIRRRYIDTFFIEYQNSVKLTLQFYGLSPEYGPSLDCIQYEFKRLKYLALVYNLILFALNTSECPKRLHVDKLSSDCDSKDCYNPNIFLSGKYRKAVVPDLINWIDESFL